MSAEPPPPDWVQSDAAFHHRRSILDGEDAGRSRSLPRVTLEAVPRVSTLGDSVRSADDGIVSTVRREWEDLAFTMLRRNQLLAFVGFVLVLALAIYGWERGTLSGMAAEISAERIEGGAPAAPRLSSDQVAWDDTLGEDGGDGRRSTASFASDRALAEAVDGDEPTTGAKLFVADGKKSKRAASSSAEDESTDDAGRDASRVAATGAADGDSADRGSTTRTPGEPTTTTAVRYENCAQAAAAGAAPIQLGEPGYRLSLDRDKDGVACENGSTPEDPGDAPVDSLYSNPTTTTSGGSGSPTTASSTGAGTTSTAESTTTSRSSTTGSTTTTAKPTSSASTTTTTTSTTVTTSTASSTTTMSTTTMSTASSTTTTTRPSTTSSTTTTSVPTTTSSTPTTVSTTDDLPPVDPIGGTQAGPT